MELRKYKNLWSENKNKSKSTSQTTEKWRAIGRCEAYAEIINDIVLKTKYIDEIKERLHFMLVQEFGNHDLIKSVLDEQFENLLRWADKNLTEANSV